MNGCHKCGNNVITLSVTIQLLHFSPKWWELENHTSCSFHRLSETRWLDRVENRQSLDAYLAGIEAALEDLLELNLTPKT